MMMKKRKIAVLITAAMLLLSACQGTAQLVEAPPAESQIKTSAAEPADTSQADETTGEQNEAAIKDEAEWTVLIYLCGTDLESEGGMGTLNLESLEKVPSSDQVNFVIQTGGTKNWQRDDINPAVLSRFTMNGGVLTEVESLPLANMGDPNTLGSFLFWGVKNYPAKRYMTVLWDHGGGPLGGAICDEIYDGSSMSVPELAKALSMAETRFEIIGFDACLMASLEVADAMSPYGNYMVASEETEPGSGWNYDGFGNYLVENPQCQGAQLGKQICDTYMDLNSNTEAFVANQLTLSVVDLNKIEPLNQAFGELVLEMGAMIPDVSAHRELYQEIDRAEKFYEGFYTIDLGDMLQKTTSLDPVVSQKVRVALNDAVVYSVNGNTRLYSNGLSILYGLNLSNGTYNAYADICPVPEYLAYLDSMNYSWRAPDWVYEKVDPMPEPVLNDYYVDYELDVNKDGRGELLITKGADAVTEVIYKLYRLDTKDDRAYCLGDGKEISADFEKGIFTEEFSGLWASIGGVYCFPHEVEDQEEYTLYNIPVMVEGWKMSLRAAYFPNDGNGYYQLYGLWNEGESGTGVPSRDAIPLEDGMEITFLFPEINNSLSSMLQYRKGETIIYDSKSTRMEDIPIKDGNYALKFEITDAMGRKYSSDSLTVTCFGGTITKEMPADEIDEETE